MKPMKRRAPRPAPTVSPEQEAALAEYRAAQLAAFGTLDEPTIRAFCSRYEVEVPDDDTEFWVGVHMTRVNLRGLEPSKKAVSERWLTKHLAAQTHDDDEPTVTYGD